MAIFGHSFAHHDSHIFPIKYVTPQKLRPNAQKLVGHWAIVKSWISVAISPLGRLGPAFFDGFLLRKQKNHLSRVGKM